MAKSEIVVGLDIGTTKVCTLVAEVSGEDQIEILGVGTAPSTGMSKGVVGDVPATSAAIRASVRAAEQMAGVHIATAYVGITGAHVASQNSRGASDISGEVAEEHLQVARHAAGQAPLPPDREILHNIPRHYVVDGQSGVRHPVGMAARRLEVETHVITASSSAVANLLRCVEREHLEIEEFVAEPLAAGLAALTDAERQLGVVLADIGGGTTDVALFVDGAITHTAVIPVGGSHVTSDLGIAFRLEPEQAEKLKRKWGTARPEDIGPEEYVQVHMVGDPEPREIPRRLLPEVIAPRMEELFHLLRRHVDAAAAEKLLVSTCVLTGGGALLPGAAECAQAVLEIPVRIGRPREVKDPRTLVDGPQYTAATGLVLYAAQRLAARSPEKEPRPLTAAALEMVMGWVRRLLRRF